MASSSSASCDHSAACCPPLSFQCKWLSPPSQTAATERTWPPLQLRSPAPTWPPPLPRLPPSPVCSTRVPAAPPSCPPHQQAEMVQAGLGERGPAVGHTLFTTGDRPIARGVVALGGRQARPNCLLGVGNDRTGFHGSQKCRGALPPGQTRASAQCCRKCVLRAPLPLFACTSQSIPIRRQNDSRRG